MMAIPLVLFWLTAALIGYVYLGYPALLFLLERVRRTRRATFPAVFEPTVSLIISAYNEERRIAAKLDNSLALDYPRDKLEIIVVSDGSRDRTAEITRGYADRGVRLTELPHNQGKACAQNEGVRQARGEIVFFADADCFFPPDTVRMMVRDFAEPRVGCVIGEDVYVDPGASSVNRGQSLYWRYEIWVRQRESNLGNLAMGSGSIMALRRELFEPLDPAISEDFVLPMQCALKGFRTIHEPEAIAEARWELETPERLLRMQIRTITLDTRGLSMCRSILNPVRYPGYAWALLSHKVLRWLAPYFLIAALALNLFLLGEPLYRLTLVAQILFYGLAGLGSLFGRGADRPALIGVPFSFCLINLAALIGIARFVSGKKLASWQPNR